jgi:hypothetical protein
LIVRPLAIGLVVLCLLAVFPAGAETHRIDDSGTQVLDGSMRLKWNERIPRGTQAFLASGQVTVLARLDVSPWKGRQARIYLRLPQQPGGQFDVAWTTQGRLMPGILRSGERTLVYAGPIRADTIEDTLRLRVEVDTRRLSREDQLEFSFEIDLGTP